MSTVSHHALLVLDFQVGVGDQDYAKPAAAKALQALTFARQAGMTVVFTKIDFLQNYSDVSERNKVFNEIKTKNLIPPGSSRIIPQLGPAAGEFVFNKNRYSGFSGNALRELLRATETRHLTLAGLDTSGVVLTTFTETIDLDFEITILSDASVDSNQSLHDVLMRDLFPRSASVVTTDAWIASHGSV